MPPPKPLKINPFPFYNEWSGHPISDLTTIHSVIRSERPDKPVVFLAGDSSLDNKAWIPSNGPAGEPLPVTLPEIYKSFLEPANPKPDVTFWLNHFLGSKATCLNAAVEASLLRQRSGNELLDHDKFIRDHIRPEDALIVSVGANDIALSPNAATMRHMFQLAWLSSRRSIEAGTASSLKYFKTMYGDQTQDYISRLVSKQSPRLIIVCMIYYPLEFKSGDQPSWADQQLKALGYNWYPTQLQTAIKKMYEQATCSIKIDGSTVVPCALFETLDGKTKEDYTAKVEPSVQGGKKMALKFEERLKEILSTTKTVYKVTQSGVAVKDSPERQKEPLGTTKTIYKVVEGAAVKSEERR